MAAQLALPQTCRPPFFLLLNFAEVVFQDVQFFDAPPHWRIRCQATTSSHAAEARRKA
jgi:hypothetical protein